MNGVHIWLAYSLGPWVLPESISVDLNVVILPWCPRMMLARALWSASTFSSLAVIEVKVLASNHCGPGLIHSVDT